MPIDLAASRVFAFEEGSRKFTMTTKPVSKALYLAYFGGIVNTQQTTKDGGLDSAYDSTGARLELLEKVLVDASGYMPEGESITTRQGWQALLPMRHRRAVSDLLFAVEQVPATDESFELGLETVELKATWTASEEGRMQEVSGLKHVFRSPSADHQKRYSRAMSRSIVTGGSRTGQTRWLGAQDVLIEIYDELIDKVEGYVSPGIDFADDPKGFAPTMDCYHKVAAATALFTPAVIA